MSSIKVVCVAIKLHIGDFSYFEDCFLRTYLALVKLVSG